jgi:hypothetical protein
LHAQDVGQVVILRDLFDQWVILTDLDPLPRLDDICNNPSNQSIIFLQRGEALASLGWVRRRQNEYQAYSTP